MTEDQLILVNENDEQTGTCGKMEAHEKSLLHRAFSIFVFRKTGSGTELLIQRRAAGKYHSAGLWANSCCSHPRDGESLEEATARRLPEETGITLDLKEKGRFIYRADFENGLTEYECDHVFTGWYSGDFDSDTMRNPQEADEMKFVSLDWIKEDIKLHPEHYTAWFIPALEIALKGD